MEVTAIGFLASIKRSELERVLKASDIVDDFDIEDLDKVDGKKDIMLMLKEPIDAKYIGETLSDLLGKLEKKIVVNDD